VLNGPVIDFAQKANLEVFLCGRCPLSRTSSWDGAGPASAATLASGYLLLLTMLGNFECNGFVKRSGSAHWVNKHAPWKIDGTCASSEFSVTMLRNDFFSTRSHDLDEILVRYHFRGNPLRYFSSINSDPLIILLVILTPNRPAMPFANRKNYFRGSFQFSIVTI